MSTRPTDERPRTSSRRGARATPRPPRRRARDLALQALYGWMVGGADPGAADAHVRELDGFAGSDVAWYDRQLHGTIAERPALEAAFVPFLDRPLGQLSPIEHAVLLLGTWELMHAPDVPWKVAIDASIELAKSFGGTDGHKFVNGVLDRVSRTLRPDERRRDDAARSPDDPEASGVSGVSGASDVPDAPDAPDASKASQDASSP